MINCFTRQLLAQYRLIINQTIECIDLINSTSCFWCPHAWFLIFIFLSSLTVSRGWIYGGCAHSLKSSCWLLLLPLHEIVLKSFWKAWAAQGQIRFSFVSSFKLVEVLVSKRLVQRYKTRMVHNRLISHHNAHIHISRCRASLSCICVIIAYRSV